MDRQQYSSCIGEGMRGKKFTTEQRKTEFCILSKMCSGKAGSREEAAEICSQPKPPKPEGGEKKRRRSRKEECPPFDASTLIPYCEKKLNVLVKSGDLPADTDVSGVCQIILG